MTAEESRPEPLNAEVEDAALPAPALNRAQRRAQAKGKSAPPVPLNPANPAANRFAGGRSGSAPTQNRLPRTGHK